MDPLCKFGPYLAASACEESSAKPEAPEMAKTAAILSKPERNPFSEKDDK
jgi:hypothetical protein